MTKVRVLGPRDPNVERQLRIGGLVVLVVVALMMVRGIYFQVEPGGVGVVTRFGRYERTVPPGLHFKLPGVETVYEVKTQKDEQEEFGFRSEMARRFASSVLGEESLMLTGDLNAAEVQWTVRYKIGSPRDYLFNVQDPENTLRDLSESVMRTVVGDRSVYEVLTVGREEVNLEVARQLQEILDLYGAGISVQGVFLQTVGPPDEKVKAAFNAVNQAEQEKERTINQANQQYNKEIPKARGEAQRTVQEAEGYRIERVNKAKGEVARFLALLEEYQKSPEVTRRRIYLETMAEVLPALGPKVVVDPAVKGLLPLLNLNSNALEGGR